MADPSADSPPITQTATSETKCRLALYKVLEFFGVLGLHLGFYGSLGLLVVGMYKYILHDNHDDHKEIRGTVIRSRPSLRFFPLPPGDNYKVFTVWYNRSDEETTAKYTKSLLNIINKEYRKDVDYVHCRHDVAYREGSFMQELTAHKKYCKVYDHAKLDWGPVCNPQGDQRITNLTGPFKLRKKAFGFIDGSPCIMIRLNRIYSWKPSKLGLTSEKRAEYKKVGVHFRQDFEKKIKNSAAYHNSSHSNYIWVSCDGLTLEDRELMGDIAYYPKERPALPKIYFPFRGQKNYLAPFIFINFIKPMFHVVIRIQCVTWDNNIDVRQHKISPVGITNFELLID